MAAVANQFIIRHIEPDSPDFLYSANLWEVAERNGFYAKERDGPLLDFLKTFAPQRAHSPYVTRCVQTDVIAWLGARLFCGSNTIQALFVTY